jgi:hypothetical protein
VVETEDHVFYHRLLRPQHALVVVLPDLELIPTVNHLLEVQQGLFLLPGTEELAEVLGVVGHQDIDEG